MTTLTTVVSVSPRGGITSSPTSQTVTQRNTTLVYELDPLSAQQWKITGLVSNDPNRQLSPAQVYNNGQAASVVDSNTVAEQFSINVLIASRTGDDRSWHDPTVKNEPPV